jgi:hypothetical protein
MKTKLHFLEASGEWAERYFNHPIDRKRIDELKGLLAQIS